MSSENIYHYVYRITNKVLKKHYYGCRTSKNIIPQNDLGVKYFSSSKDKKFRQDQKENPQNYKYKIVRIFQTRKDAANFEIFLHNKFDVGKNSNFYNKAKATSYGFSCVGITGENHFNYGRKHSLESRIKISKNNARLFGDKNPMFGKRGSLCPSFGRKMSQESIEKMKRNQPSVKGENNPMFGKHHSPETISKHYAGENNPMFGYEWSLSQKINASLKLSTDKLSKYTTIMEFSHKQFGTYLCTAFELSEKFPEQNLIFKYIMNVARGKSKKHRGWIINYILI